MTHLLSLVLSLALVYLVFAIVVSRLQERLAEHRDLRGRFLRQGINRLVGDEGLASRLLQQPLIGSLYRDPGTRRPPSYVDPASFALALADVLVRRSDALRAPRPGTGADNAATAAPTLRYDRLREALVELQRQDAPVAATLLPIVDRASSLEEAIKGIEGWYAAGMDRVSGWYKKSARRGLFWIGLAVAAVANVDTIEIFRHLNARPQEAAALADLAREVQASGKIGGVDLVKLRDRAPDGDEWRAIRAAIEAPRPGLSLPIGYGCLALLDAGQADTRTCRDELAQRVGDMGPGGWLVKLLGWILTAFAGSLGATYWFAAMGKVINIRGGGPKPVPASDKPAGKP